LKNETSVIVRKISETLLELLPLLQTKSETNMKVFFALLMVSFLLPTGKVFSQAFDDEDNLARYEFSFGLGTGIAFETDVFKTDAEKVKAEPSPLINMALHYTIDENLSFGFLLEGYAQTISNIPVIIKGVSKLAKFDLSVNNIGLDVRWTFSRGKFEPYGFVAVNLVTGSLQNDDLGNLKMNGMSFGGGLGTKLNLSEHWAASIEAVGFIGTAKWKEKVFTNSTGTNFNPGHAGFTIGVVCRWGD